MEAARKSDLLTDRYLSLPDAAKRLGKARATVLKLVVSGDLRGAVVAGRAVIEIASIDEYEARATPPETTPV